MGFINNKVKAFELVVSIIILPLVEVQYVAQARAAATLHPYSQRQIRIETGFFLQTVQFIDSSFRKPDRRLCHRFHNQIYQTNGQVLAKRSLTANVYIIFAHQ